jgi:hypothetical protein
VQAAAKAAFQYGYPLTETMRVCDLAPSVNRLQFSATLATAQSRAVVAPNNDTLYGSACAYLGAGWVRVTMPASNGRYMSLQVLDAYTNTAAIRGPKHVAPSGGQYVLKLAGSTQAGLPDGVPVIEVNTPYAYLLTRTLVDSPSDLAAADAAQQQITLVANSTTVAARASATGGTTAAQDFFLRLMQRLAQNPPLAGESALVASFSAAGVTPASRPSVSNASGEQLAAWEIAYRDGLAALDAGSDVAPASLGSLRGGWSFPGPGLGNFGVDYAYRALIARKGLFALTSDEAVYVSASSDAGGAALDGRTGYTLRLPAGWPPVDVRGFWSLTLYGPDRFLVANAIDRYSIGGRTRGLAIAGDGSLTLYVQCTDPGGARSANWLPAPCGRFSLTMRLYLPTDKVLEPAFTLPVLQPNS